MLAIEGGGTKTRILLADAAGNVLARELGGPASGLYVRPRAYVRGIRPLLRRVRRVADRLGGRVTTAGLGAPMDRTRVEECVRQIFGPVRFVGVGENEMALALYGLRWGISLVAGTGSSCRATNERGEHAGCGGFGPQFGDAGSGYYIGRSAISAAMLAGDGRGAPTVLSEKLCAFYGIARVREIFQFVDRSGHVAGPKVAALTPKVFEAALEGDIVANRICRDAGRELGKLVAAAAHRLAWRKQPVPLVLTGGVFNGGDLILAPLRRVLRADTIDFDVLPPVPEPAEGIFKFMRMRRETG